MDLLTTSNIIFALGLLAMIFSVYHYFRNPQISNDKKDALLRQEVQWSKESTDKRFMEIQNNFKDLLVQNSNHIHSIDLKVDKISDSLTCLSMEVTRLATIIEERVPKAKI
jgi:hypothetical protein